MPVASESEQVDAVNANTPLIPENSAENERALATTSAEAKPADQPTELEAEVKLVQTLPNEYRFIQQRIPPKNSLLRYTLPALLLGFQVVFIILFAFFGKYTTNKPLDSVNEQDARKYPMFQDLHVITLLGFGFLMAFLKRYGYGSIGFNLLLVAFIIQWALLIRGWIELNINCDGQFKIGLENLINADFTAVAILVSFGALLGKTTLTQLVVLALIEVVVQVANETLNVTVIKAHDTGRSVYVHLFGALFGLAVSKVLNLKGVNSYKESSVYHSDMFALIGTLFLWAFYPSFNGLLAKNLSDNGHTKAVINTVIAISASCVVTFGVSTLVGKGKINVLHVQHATIAGGIAIGSVADLNVQVYIALIVGSLAGLVSTLGYQYIDPFLRKTLKLHDTCSVQSLHFWPGLIAALLGIIYAACSFETEYKDALFDIYPARQHMGNSSVEEGAKILGRTAGEQSAFQAAALAITASVAIVSGLLTGFLLRLPLFEQLSKNVEMFDDEVQWVTPDDYALKLTLASNQISEKREESKV